VSRKVLPSKILQEFYCASSGGGCGGYITFKINMALEGTVEMVCPKCKHKHQRIIDRGEIKEQGRYDSNPVQEIHTTMAAWHKTPITKRMKKMQVDVKKVGYMKDLRDGVGIASDDDLVSVPKKDKIAARMVGSLWHRNASET
jgi:hypothetical protein